jgi:TRAP transporter 4TM/12TM fusion protein
MENEKHGDKQAKLDKKIERRRAAEPANKMLFYSVFVVGVFFSFFYWLTCGIGSFSTESHRGVYFILTMIMSFLLFRPTIKNKKKNPSVLDYLLAVAAIVIIGMWMIMYPDYALNKIGNPDTIHIVLGGLIILLSLEVARRVVGYVLPVLALIFLAYAYFGPYIPGMMGHYGFPLARIFEFIGFGMNGIWGVVVNTYATYIFPFIIFASFLQATGGGKAIEKISTAIAGGTRGGPAKIAVVSSGLIGSVTGSSAANAVVTGSYTIPIMKNLGYRAHTAAGIEAAASTGGQFMPPIMGAAAFLIAAFTRTPYLDIVKISIIPALLYFIGVGMMVHFIACRRGIKGLPKDQLPPIKETLLKQGYLLLPIIIIFVMIVAGFSPQLAAFWSIISSIALSFITPENRMTPKRIAQALYGAAKTSLTVGATAGVIGIIVGVVSMSGLGVKFSAFIISLSGGLLPITILLIAVGGYFIGMGVTITATYILLAVLAVPALTNLGVGIIAAHLLVFWFCNVGGITPPVCLVAFAASSIADCKPMDAGWAALRLSSPLFIIPLLFVYTPILFTWGTTYEIWATVVTSFIGIIAYAGMMQGYWLKMARIVTRVALGIAALLLFIPTLPTDIAGLVLIVAISIFNYKTNEGELATQEW